MQTLDLQRIGLIYLSESDFFHVEGGNRYKRLYDGVKWVVEKAGIYDFFSDMWSGIKEGYNEVRN